MPTYRVDLQLPRDELLRYYRGAARWVNVRSLEGVRLQFGADVLRPFVTPAGVYGRFLLEVDAGNRLRRISRLSGH